MKAVNFVTPEHEHEFEAVHGLPEALPAGEVLLWQGRPNAWLLACEALHLRTVMVYFGLLMVWRLTGSLYDGASVGEALMALLRMLPLVLLGTGLLGLFGLLMARSTAYTLTNRRVVMRIGIVLSVTFNLPFSRIRGVDLRSRGGTRGDVALTLAGTDRIAYLHLWPHVRAWQLRQPQPLLRGLADAQQVAGLLVDALHQSQQAQQEADMAPAQLPLRATRRPVFEPVPAAAQTA